MTDDDPAATDWPRAILESLKALDVRQVAYVPDAGHKQLIEMAHADETMRAIALTSEEEGIGLASGAWLGGQRAVVLMQSSGAGNCVNAIASLTRACRLPLLLLVTMRGEEGEGNPWQVPMGEATAPMFKTLGLKVPNLWHPADAGNTVENAGRLAFEEGHAVAVLIRQSLVGVKEFAE